MANIKYIRVSTAGQNTDRQEADAVTFDKVFIEKASGKNTDRPELKAMLEYLREGDTLTVESYSRLARDTRDLLDIVDKLHKKGVTFISQKEQIDTSTPAGRFMFSVFASLAQFEREQILIRQAEGIAAAKAAGKHLGRKKAPIPENFEKVVKAWRKKEITAVEAMKQTNMTKTLFYQTVKNMGL